jgi:hypothetical protein
MTKLGAFFYEKKEFTASAKKVESGHRKQFYLGYQNHFFWKMFQVELKF